ncbi:superoxide dismutase [Coprobacter sp.]
MKYELPQLPYEYDALEPAISKKTIEFHYGKHEQTYINNLNNLIKDTPYEDTPIETIIKEADGALFNNASQAWNHIFYFFSFTPHKSEGPKGSLAKAIDEKWGSFENFKKAFVDMGVAQFGSGWVWLVKDKEGKLDIIKEGNAGNPMTKGYTPLLTFDVWEHAYYLDYQNRRADHLNGLWDIVDWKVVEDRY